MIVKNDYNECITNFACSIRKYFNLEYKHNTLEYVDKILEEKNPKNVVTILLDGMGSIILDNVLNKDDFFIKNRKKAITTVFPATTVAATTSVTTGLNPVETGMLGWTMYYKDLDKVITVFRDSLKEDSDENALESAKKYKEKNMITKTIEEEINENGKYKGFCLMPFGEDCYSDLEEMVNNIEKLCNQEGKKYIYAYDTNPDGLMHKYGTYSKEAIDAIKYRSIMIERLCNKLHDTVVFVVADHGHTPVENIHLEDYPQIVDCLWKDTSIEPRATNFFIKEGKKEEFVKLFNENFGEYYDLYPINEVIESKLFGDGTENKIFRDALGDFLAIAKSSKTILYNGNDELVSTHAGYKDEEIMIPLIIIECN